MMIVDIGISRIQASLSTMLDNDVVVACAWIEGRGLLTCGDEPAGMRWMIVYVVNKMGYPPPAAALIGYFVDDVTELCGLGEHLINVGVLNSHQAPISEGCIRGHLARSQAEPIDVVLLGVETFLEITPCSEAFEQGQLNVNASFRRLA